MGLAPIAFSFAFGDNPFGNRTSLPSHFVAPMLFFWAQSVPSVHQPGGRAVRQQRRSRRRLQRRSEATDDERRRRRASHDEARTSSQPVGPLCPVPEEGRGRLC